MNIDKCNIVKSSWKLWYFVLITGKQILVYYTSSLITRFHPLGITKNNQIRIITKLIDSKKQTTEEYYITLVSYL